MEKNITEAETMPLPKLNSEEMNELKLVVEKFYKIFYLLENRTEKLLKALAMDAGTKKDGEELAEYLKKKIDSVIGDQLDENVRDPFLYLCLFCLTGRMANLYSPLDPEYYQEVLTWAIDHCYGLTKEEHNLLNTEHKKLEVLYKLYLDAQEGYDRLSSKLYGLKGHSPGQQSFVIINSNREEPADLPTDDPWGIVNANGPLNTFNMFNPTKKRMAD